MCSGEYMPLLGRFVSGLNDGGVVSEVMLVGRLVALWRRVCE